MTQLKRVIEGEISLLERMYQLLARERVAIFENDFEELMTIASEKEEMGRAHGVIEGLRRSAVEEFALKRKGEKRELSADQVLELMSEEEKGEFQPLFSRLRELARKVSWENRHNAFLIEKAREINDGLLRIFVPLMSPPTYNRNGEFWPSKTTSSRFLAKT